jgi:uncharacterized protein (UPF0335 family)
VIPALPSYRLYGNKDWMERIHRVADENEELKNKFEDIFEQLYGHTSGY